MTKQEEIKEGINQYLTKRFICDIDGEVPSDECLHEANALLAYLHSQGVVIKVDKVDSCDDCPHNHPYTFTEPFYDGKAGSDCDLLFQLPKGCHKYTTNEAGYVVVEPLIKEEK